MSTRVSLRLLNSSSDKQTGEVNISSLCFCTALLQSSFVYRTTKFCCSFNEKKNCKRKEIVIVVNVFHFFQLKSNPFQQKKYRITFKLQTWAKWIRMNEKLNWSIGNGSSECVATAGRRETRTNYFCASTDSNLVPFRFRPSHISWTVLKSFWCLRFGVPG